MQRQRAGACFVRFRNVSPLTQKAAKLDSSLWEREEIWNKYYLANFYRTVTWDEAKDKKPDCLQLRSHKPSRYGTP